MQPTTIKIPPELKSRVAAVAAEEGKTVHAFLLEAIEKETGCAERRREFVAAALAAEKQMMKAGTGYRAGDVHKYLRAQAAGEEFAASKGGRLAKVIYARSALADLDRLAEFAGEDWSEEVVELVIEAVELLARHPLIGREAEHGLRELIISRGRTGFLALYRFREEADTIFVLALRHQRELGG